MMNLFNRARYVMTGEDGASNVEIIIWISVVLVISTILFAFKDAIIGFLTKANTKVNGLVVD